MVYEERNIIFGKALAQLVSAKSRFKVVYNTEKSNEDMQCLLWKAVDEDICGEITYPLDVVRKFAFENILILEIADTLVRNIEETVDKIENGTKQFIENLRIAVLYKEDFADDYKEDDLVAVLVPDEEDDKSDFSLFATVVLLNEDESEYEIVTQEMASEYGLDLEDVEKIAFANSEDEEYFVDKVYVNRQTIEFLDDLEDYAEELLELEEEDDEEDDEENNCSGNNDKENQTDAE